MKVLIINLKQSTERLAQQQRQFNQLGLSFERLPAVSIHDFDDEEYNRLAFSGQRPLKKAELACFLSHKKAWEYVLAANEPCAILEDDAVLVKDFAYILAELKQQDIDFVNLEVHGRKKIVSSTEHFSIVNQQYDLLRLFLDRSGTGGYIIYPSGARILLSYMQQRSIGLADEFIHSCNALKRSSSFTKTTHGLSLKEKCAFKTRRVLRQVVLGYYLIKFRTQGERRYIEVDSNRF